ncbi:MAG: hypothetical protein PHQ47_00550 [Candidatus Portnoybacteria bacterium]|nr:hypothetical protein [Candidatus Portnoybacteria bacterium]
MGTKILLVAGPEARLDNLKLRCRQLGIALAIVFNYEEAKEWYQPWRFSLLVVFPGNSRLGTQPRGFFKEIFKFLPVVIVKENGSMVFYGEPPLELLEEIFPENTLEREGKQSKKTPVALSLFTRREFMAL